MASSTVTGKVLIPAMADAGTKLLAAAFRAVGVDAAVTPRSDFRTLELGARHTCGDECFPAKITIGDFLRLLEEPGTDPARTVLFMPLADGPCRFGQYAPHLRQVLDANGYQQVRILSPTCGDGYSGLGDLARPFLRSAWRAAVAGDLITKLLMMTRPYEVERGAADRAFSESLQHLCRVIEAAPLRPRRQLQAICDGLAWCRDRFLQVEIRRNPGKPLIGIVGEIFCRLNSFSNQDLVRSLEEHGAEAWISDFGEWVWYSNAEELRLLRLQKRLLSLRGLGAWLRWHVQRRDEEALLEPLREHFAARREPSIREVLESARPYLPPEGAVGEMVLNVGKVVCFAGRGVDGIIDISPFTCMNGIVSEAIYPRVSADLGGLPIRNLYFDGTATDLELDLGIFLEMARAWRQRRA